MRTVKSVGRLGVLGVPEGAYVRQLVAAGERMLGADAVRLIAYTDLEIGVDAAGNLGSPQLDLEAILVRSMPLGSLEQVIFRMDCLHALQAAGLRIINSPRSLEVAIDKWLTLDRLRAAGVLVPATRVVQTRESALAAWEAFGGDAVVKPLFGGEGRGLMRVDNRDMAWRVFGTLQQLRAVMYVQEFVPHLGYDVRILLVGESAYAIRRRAPQGRWRTNLSQGATAEPHRARASELELARRCGEAVGGEVVGVDLLPGADGRLRVLEVNAVPGWRGIERVLGVDVAAEIVKYCIGRVKQ